jgi:hypothetical protein
VAAATAEDFLRKLRRESVLLSFMLFIWRVFDPNNFGWERRQGQRAHFKGAIVARLPWFQS